jgi:lipopolysaccharide transport system ATP-binding protein
MNYNTRMDPENALEIEGLKKRYYHKESTGGLKDLLIRLKGNIRREEYWALQGIDLVVPKGRTLGIIGNNGAGKSTLLRMICGLGRPTQGIVKRRGQLASLLELGVGFNQEFTGRENVITAMLLSGLTRKDALGMLSQVVEFSELADFIDSPIRTYSSGMVVRLGFSAAICTDPDLIVVDEVLEVGDLRFKKKCRNHMLKMKESGKTIIIVSHSMDQIEALCDEVVWIENGRVRQQGETGEVVKSYRNRLFATASKDGNVEESADDISGPQVEFRSGKTIIELERVWLVGEDGLEIDAIAPGYPLSIKVAYCASSTVTRPIFQVGLYREDGIRCYETSTQADNVFLEEVHGNGILTLDFSELSLMEGHYYLDVGIFHENWERAYEFRHRAAEFHVIGHTPGKGIFLPPHRWQTS